MPIRRPYIRKPVRQTVEGRAAKNDAGQFLDANTGKPIEGKYDLGHVYGHEHRREAKKAEDEGLSQKDFNDRMNNPNYYQIESPSVNRSRRHEKPDTPTCTSTVITRDKITLKCPYPIWDFYRIEITHQVNNHAKLTVLALLESNTPEELQKIIYSVNEDDEIQVSIQNNEENEVLFTGIPVKADIKINQNNGFLIMECCSGTYNMDMRESSRSFQDTSMQYTDMFDFVMKHYPQGDSINTGADGKAIERPIIQYKETDWNFLKRMASEVGTVLTADVSSKNPKLWLGLPESRKTVTISRDMEVTGVWKPLIRRIAESLNQKEHYYYETPLPEHIKIGDTVDVFGNALTVTYANFIYAKEDGVLRNLYHLEKPPEIKWHGNERVRGVSLEGEILDVKLNHVKIHLDIDPSQSVDEAFWYPCKAEANNVWYVMPHIGERVSLHIADIKETGLCMTETRGTEAQMGIPRSLSKPTEKYMLTKWHKQLALHEEDIEWDIPPINILMTEDSVFVESNDKITIQTHTELNLGRSEFAYTDIGRGRIIAGQRGTVVEETKDITLEAEELITLQVTSTESIIELDEYNRIHSPINVKEFGGHSVPRHIVHRRRRNT